MSVLLRIGGIALLLAVVASALACGQVPGEGIARRLPPDPNSSLGPQRNTCPICLQNVSFMPDGEPARLRAVCPYCGSLERHRLLYLYLRQKTNLFRADVSVLHFSPEQGIARALAAQKNLKYATSWYEPDRPADYHLDLTKLALPDNSWDVLIAYHILEHITDDRTAMREMYRVLKPGGWAALQVPTLDQPGTYEDATVVSGEDRAVKFGNSDHVRYYGWQDFADRLTEAGFEVTIERYAQQLSDSAIREFALARNERIYIARKPMK
jgi:predicted SAM-dependent methyltransferase